MSGVGNIDYENFTGKTADPKKNILKNKVLGNWHIFMLYFIKVLR